MRPYEILISEEIEEYINLVIDNYNVVEHLTITPPSVEFDDYGLSFNFQVGTNQETGDEYIFNDGDTFVFSVDSELTSGFYNTLGFYITFYYYELDKADIDDTKSYDSMQSMDFIAEGGEEFTVEFEKPTYLLKKFQVIIKKQE